MSTATWSVNRLAARAIALVDLPVAERRELLDMLGLLDRTGRAVAPDDLVQYDLNNRFVGYDDEYSQGKLSARFDEPPRPRDNPHLPEGLRNLKPGLLTVAIQKARPDNCGSIAGHSAHKRRGEQPCVLCADARRAYNTARRPKKEQRYLAPCGTATAAARHRRNDEPLDDACRLAANAARAEAKRKKRARERGDAA